MSHWGPWTWDCVSTFLLTPYLSSSACWTPCRISVRNTRGFSCGCSVQLCKLSEEWQEQHWGGFSNDNYSMFGFSNDNYSMFTDWAVLCQWRSWGYSLGPLCSGCLSAVTAQLFQLHFIGYFSPILTMWQNTFLKQIRFKLEESVRFAVLT